MEEGLDYDTPENNLPPDEDSEAYSDEAGNPVDANDMEEDQNSQEMPLAIPREAMFPGPPKPVSSA